MIFNLDDTVMITQQLKKSLKSEPKSTEAERETTEKSIVTEPTNSGGVDEKVVDKKGNGGVAAVVIIVLIVVAIVAFVLYKRCKSDYQGMWL